MKKTLSWFEPDIGGIDNKYLKKCLKNGFPNEGEITFKFLDIIKKKIGSKYAVGSTSGTTAIYLALKSLNIGFRDEVIIPNVTFIATANAVHMTGAKPIMVDVNEHDLNMNFQEIEKKITKKTKAIIPVHVSGKAANIYEIKKIAKRNNIYMVEDSAEALFSKTNNKYLGTIGDLGCFSLAPNKIITSGQGGIIVTNNKKLYLNLIKLKDQGRTTRKAGKDGIHNYIGYNFKLTNIQSSIALAQLENISMRINRMKRNYYLYQKKLSKLNKLRIIKFDISGGELPLWTCVVYKKRDQLIEYLKKFNINCRKFWLPVNHQKPYRETKKNLHSHYKVSNKIYKNIFWLPSSYKLTDKDIGYITNKLKIFYNMYE